mmetsp:Transcript_6749/g.11858  ORF Transcript_6749/g.11858 Transcript_6749/m.11858 type:complete len:215 (+) Transcript_6749:1713-2357(+)
MNGWHLHVISVEACNPLYQVLLGRVPSIHTEVIWQLWPLQNHMSNASGHVTDVNARNIVRSITYESQCVRGQPSGPEQTKEGLLAISIWQAGAHHIRLDILLVAEGEDLRLYQLPLQKLGSRNSAHIVLRSKLAWSRHHFRWNLLHRRLFYNRRWLLWRLLLRLFLRCFLGLGTLRGTGHWCRLYWLWRGWGWRWWHRLWHLLIISRRSRPNAN